MRKDDLHYLDIPTRNNWYIYWGENSPMYRDMFTIALVLFFNYCMLISFFSTQLFFFVIWIFFQKHSRFTGQQGKGDGISLTPLYHFHPLHRHLEISQGITVESSLHHIISNIWKSDKIIWCFFYWNETDLCVMYFYIFLSLRHWCTQVLSSRVSHTHGERCLFSLDGPPF